MIRIFVAIMLVLASLHYKDWLLFVCFVLMLFLEEK